MSTTNFTEKEAVINWVVFKEGVVKFVDDDALYDLAEDVVKFLSNGALEEGKANGVKVKVRISDTKSEDGNALVEHLTLDNLVNTEETPTEKEPKSETMVDNRVEILTVAGVYAPTRGIIFQEHENLKPKKWFTIGENLDPEDIKSNYSKKRVEVIIIPVEGKKNDIIDQIKIVEDQPQEVVEEKSNGTSTFNGTTQHSIEAQVAVEHAQRFVADVYGSNVDLDPEDFNKLIEERAIANYDLMQTMKKR